MPITWNSGPPSRPRARARLAATAVPRKPRPVTATTSWPRARASSARARTESMSLMRSALGIHEARAEGVADLEPGHLEAVPDRDARHGHGHVDRHLDDAELAQ